VNVIFEIQRTGGKLVAHYGRLRSRLTIQDNAFADCVEKARQEWRGDARCAVGRIVSSGDSELFFLFFHTDLIVDGKILG
jgi:hypothetical protein